MPIPDADDLEAGYPYNSVDNFEIIEAKEGLGSARMQVAPTKHPERPRARLIGYDYNTNILYIQFRASTPKYGTDLIQYADVPEGVWNRLKVAPSTGEFLAANGFDDHQYEISPASFGTGLSREQELRKVFEQLKDAMVDQDAPTQVRNSQYWDYLSRFPKNRLSKDQLYRLRKRGYNV